MENNKCISPEAGDIKTKVFSACVTKASHEAKKKRGVLFASMYLFIL